MKNLLYLLAFVLPLGLTAQEDDDDNDKVKVEITITKDGETKHITKEFDASMINDDMINQYIEEYDIDGDDVQVIMKKMKHGMHYSHAKGDYNYAFRFSDDESGEGEEVAFLGVSGHTQTFGEGSVVMLDKIFDDEAAKKAGLQPGDIVVAVGDDAISDIEGFVKAIRSKEPGDVVEFEIKRDGKRMKYDITMGSKKLGTHFMKMGPGEHDVHKMIVLKRVHELSDEEREMIKKKVGATVNSTNEFDDADLEIYPNPTQGAFEYEFNTSDAGNLEVMVFNTAGEVILEQNLNSTEGAFKGSLDLSSQASGDYIVLFKMGDKMLAQKIIKI